MLVVASAVSSVYAECLTHPTYHDTHHRCPHHRCSYHGHILYARAGLTGLTSTEPHLFLVIRYIPRRIQEPVYPNGLEG